MLVLSRKEGESIIIKTADGDIEIVLEKIKGRRGSIGVKAPKHIRVIRKELEGTPCKSDGLRSIVEA